MKLSRLFIENQTVIVDRIQRKCTIVEITVCYDLYLENAYQEKVTRYQELCDYLERNGFSVKLVVLCFGSLGCVKNDVWKGLRNFCQNKENVKNVMKWCSISCIIGGNCIWRNRVKKLLGQDSSH